MVSASLGVSIIKHDNGNTGRGGYHPIRCHLNHDFRVSVLEIGYLMIRGVRKLQIRLVVFLQCHFLSLDLRKALE